MKAPKIGFWKGRDFMALIRRESGFLVARHELTTSKHIQR